MPALEAMACGRAVICSHTSSLPEVVDGAAILRELLQARTQFAPESSIVVYPSIRIG